MGKGLATREAIVGEALRQASRLGLEGMSLAPLAERLSLSKSGLFAHFKSKEALQLGILDEAIERFKREVLAPSSRERSPSTRLRAIFERYLKWIRGTEDDGGCLFMTMAQEYDDRPGPIRDHFVQSQKAWQAHLDGIVREGVKLGEFGNSVDSKQAVFEIMGAALAYQHAAKLMGDGSARRRAIKAFERLIADLRN